MPTYQYSCTSCDADLEVVQSFSDATLTECPSCSGRLRKRYGSVGIVFKGSGFYKTDSRGASSATSKPDASSEPSTESSSGASAPSSGSSSSGSSSESSSGGSGDAKAPAGSSASGGGASASSSSSASGSSAA